MMEVRSVGIIPGMWISGEVFPRHTISAAVAVGRSMEGLVQVAHKVNDKSQRVGTLRGGRIPTFQNGQLIGDGGQYAAARGAEIFRRAMRHA